ncbi:hypothetical protein GCM10027048_21230 [Hymenobacter coalescens]
MSDKEVEGEKTAGREEAAAAAWPGRSAAVAAKITDAEAGVPPENDQVPRLVIGWG